MHTYYNQSYTYMNIFYVLYGMNDMYIIMFMYPNQTSHLDLSVQYVFVESIITHHKYSIKYILQSLQFFFRV